LRSQTPSAGRQFAGKQNVPRSGRFAEKTDELPNSNVQATAAPTRRHCLPFLYHNRWPDF
jgi:hypothetical protein